MEPLAAMLFASDALMLFPNERSYLDLADEIALASPVPLSTVPAATGAVHVATAAVRAQMAGDPLLTEKFSRMMS